MTVDPYVDPLEAIGTWINEHGKGRLVGAGKPLPNGVSTERLVAGKGAAAHMTWIGTRPDVSDWLTTPLLSFTIHAITEPAARRGAIALANWLRQAEGQPIPLGAATLASCDDINGPRLGPDGSYLVDATLTFEPSS